MRNRSLVHALSSLMAFTLVAGSSLSTANAHRAFEVQGRSDAEWEEKFRAIPQAERIKESMRVLSAEPHHIGSPAGRKNAEWMRDRMKSWGLDATLEEFDVLFPMPKERVLEMNALLYQSERALLSEAGLPRRDWFKHQIYAPGFYTGYGVKTLPGVREAIERKNWSEASEQVKVAGKTLDAMATQITGATRKLSGQ